MNAQIIGIGTLSPAVQRLLSQEFAACDITVAEFHSVENTDEALRDAAFSVLRRSNFLCVCGNLSGEMIRKAAAALGLPWDTESDTPRGGTVFLDENGTLLGFAAKKYEQQFLLLPAEVDLLLPLFSEQIIPFLKAEQDDTYRSHTVGVFGLSEAAVTERVGDLLTRLNPSISLFPNEGGEILLRIAAKAADSDVAEALCTAAIEDVCERLQSFVWGVDASNLQTIVVRQLKEKNMKIATAESCTAGLLSGKLTQVAGASAVFECGVAAYSKEIKRDVLGVPANILNTQGAVCADTAAEMAIGARRVGGSDIGVGITGEAGPESAEGKPVGTVYIALADARRVWVKELHAGDVGRDTVRKMATCHTLDLVRRYLEALPAVMAGGRLLDEQANAHPIIQKAAPQTRWRVLSSIFPWKGDSFAAKTGKSVMWISILAVLAAAVILLNTYVLAPARNREQFVSLEILYSQGNSNSNYAPEDFPAGMLSRFYALYERNPDIKGWIQIPDTRISYPVVQNSALDYSALNFSKEHSEYGVPYFDPNVSLTSPRSVNRSFVIHGNNSEDGQMFSDLHSYTNADFLLEHPLIEMNTIYATGHFEVFAVLYVDENEKSNFDYRTVTFQGNEEFADFCKEIQKRSLFITSSAPNANDTLLLLKTDASAETGENGVQLIVAARMLRLGETENDLILSHNPRPLMPQVMQRDPTTTAGQAVSTTTAYQSSDVVPDIDMPEPDETTIEDGETTTVTAETTASSDKGHGEETTTEGTSAPTVTKTESTAATTSTSSAAATTSAPSTSATTQPTTTPTAAPSGGEASALPLESAFYSTITVRIGSSAVAPIRSREELQYAVACLVKTEMGTARSMQNSTEAQKAQAVAGYTYMLYSCRNGGVFSISSTIDLNNVNDKKIYDAVGDVVGVKMIDTAQTSLSSMPLCAMYFSSCNGATACCQNVYTAALPYLQSVVSVYDTEEYVKKYSGNSALTSTCTITWAELKAKLDAYVAEETNGTVTVVSLEEGGPTPLYAKTYDAAGGYVVNTNAYYVYKGKTEYLRGIDIRKAIGSSKLRSHSFTIEYNESNDQMTFTAKGHGHALGLSQYGAIGYANEAGWTYRQILNHYYSLLDNGRYRIVMPNWD